MSEHRPTPDNTNPHNLDVFDIALYLLEQEGYDNYSRHDKAMLIGKLAVEKFPPVVKINTHLNPRYRYVDVESDPANPDYYVVARDLDGNQILVPEGHDPFEDERSWEQQDEEDGDS